MPDDYDIAPTDHDVNNEVRVTHIRARLRYIVGGREKGVTLIYWQLDDSDAGFRA